MQCIECSRTTSYLRMIDTEIVVRIDGSDPLSDMRSPVTRRHHVTHDTG